MPLSWNEIRQNAITFSKEWASESREEAEAKTFWDEFFKVFGIKRRTIASFEEPVKKLSGQWGFIDLFWKGTLLAEHKSRGKSLDKAHAQAMDYIQGLKNANRDKEIPEYVAVSDFARIALHNLEDCTSVEFPLEDLYKNVQHFAFIPGYKQHVFADQDPINIEAVELLGDLHDELEAGGYTGHDLERFLVRVLFCLFAEDTGLFDRDAFTLYLENHTTEDGSDLGAKLARLFQVLNQPEDKRQANLLEDLAALPYVNGDLFAEPLAFADFNRKMRDRLLVCCGFDWSKISPAVFGSLFQSVMQPKERRQVGAHYTSERDILKLVRSLFLDDLRAEFARLASSKGTQREARLKDFHAKLGDLKFLDPACGCGNFLVVTYRELRLLEIDVLKAIHGTQLVTDIQFLSAIDVDAMYGIEINEFPAQIAQVAMWLVDHQMNQKLSEAFGQYFARLPLKKSATIRHANALRIDWNDVLPAAKCGYVLGNPPFVGAKYQTDAQRADVAEVGGGISSAGLLDYVAFWYFKAADYIRGTAIPCGFVSTNSITQGEQVGVLWGELFRRGVKIRFAHRTFAWQSEARGAAHVHVVIIGFGLTAATTKTIFDYEQDPQQPQAIVANNISPYLVEGSDTVVCNRSTPLCAVPKMVSGNKPIDDGNYLFTPQQRQAFLALEPDAAPYFKRWLGSEEFINNIERWYLYVGEANPQGVRRMPEVLKRVEAVKAFRSASKSEPTRRIAATPTRFHTSFVATKPYLALPQVSSERRRYIPMAYLTPEYLVGDKLRLVADATLYHFGVLTSAIHMAWVNRVTGRLKSDYQYSVKLVYNNFPWPEAPTDKQRESVEAKAQAVLDARAQFPDSSLADLYDPLTMPPALQKAHAELDKAVEVCYRKAAFGSDRERVEFLFALYEKLTSPLTAGLATSKKTRAKKGDEGTSDAVGSE